MALMRVDDYEKQESGSGFSKALFWTLRVNADEGSQKKNWELPNGKKISGYMEDGWFLGRMKDLLVISFHRSRKDKSLILCNKSFQSDEERVTCPACDEYSADKENDRIGYMEQVAMLPFLATRRQDNPVIANDNEILPIYWFEMIVTSYREDYKENWLRFRDANEKYPISKHPYRIFARKRGEKEIQKWYFKAIKETDSHAISVSHPIIDEWFDEDKGRFIWNRDYMELLSGLAIVRFKQYVDPSTREPFEYGGEYEQAVRIFDEVCERYGSPKTPVEGVSDDSDDDDEELD